MGYKRKLNKAEESLLNFLIEKASLNLPFNWNESLMVQQMDDGGMGSLKLFPQGIDDSNKLFGKKASECYFLDDDSVKVIATLNLDENGQLFELDVWKTDFNPLIKIPNNFQSL
jgi:hypothetical protein